MAHRAVTGGCVVTGRGALALVLVLAVLMCGWSALASAGWPLLVAVAAVLVGGCSAWARRWGRASLSALVVVVVTDGAVMVCAVIAAVVFGALCIADRAWRIRLVEAWDFVRPGGASWGQRRLAWRVRRTWADVAYHSGLTEADRRGDDVSEVRPLLVSIVPTLGGLRLFVLPPEGQDYSQWDDACDRLAMAWGVLHVRTNQDVSGEGVVVLDVTRDDPLAGVRTSETADEAVTAVGVDAAEFGPEEPTPGTGGPVVLGRDDSGDDVVVDLREATHIAIQGMTRSGKSSAVYTLLGGCAEDSSVVVCGVDPSEAVLYPWLGRGHDEWIAIGEDDFERAAEALEGLVEEMTRRTRMVVHAWGQDKIEPHQFGRDLPVIAVVLEEFPGTVSGAAREDARVGRKPGGKVAERISGAKSRLVREGAKAGIRVVVLAQRMSAKAIETDDRSNFGLAMTLAVDGADSVGMLHADAAEWVPLVVEFPPGRALVDRPGHRRMQMQVDLTTYTEYRARVVGPCASAGIGMGDDGGGAA